MTSGKRVMLVAPPGRCTPTGSFHAVPPEGVARLAAWLRLAGFEVAVLDVLMEGYSVRVQEGKSVRYGLSAEQAATRIARWSPDAIGLSCLFTCTAPDVFEIARACRAVMPEAPIVLGGAHAAADAASILESEPAVTCVALSEGEEAFVSFLECVRQGGQQSEVPGFAHRCKDGNLSFRPLKGLLDLSQLPLPAWDLFPLDAYAKANAPHFGVGSKRRFLATSWSRGCVNSCGFCLSPKLWGAGVHRKRTAENILGEAEALQRAHEIEELHVEDDCLLSDRDWFHDVLDGIARRSSELRLNFPNGLDVRNIDRETADKLSRAGTVRAALSFDAGEPARALRWTSKRLPVQQGREVVAALHDGGIELVGLFMIGFPGQTIADMTATVEYALSLGLDSLSIFIVTPFPGTRLHSFCEREGLLIRPHGLKDYRFSTGLIRTPEFGPEDTERIRREGWEEFHRRRRGGC